MMSNVIDFRRHRDARRYEDAVAEQKLASARPYIAPDMLARINGGDAVQPFEFRPAHPPEKPRWRQEIGGAAILALAFALGALAACGSLVALAWLVTEVRP